MYAALTVKQNLRSTYCSIEANDRHEASRGLFATAELLQLNRSIRRRRNYGMKHAAEIDASFLSISNWCVSGFVLAS